MSNSNSDCNFVSERLHAYVDDMVDAGEGRMIERHLARCALCRGELAQLRDIESRLAKLVRTSPITPADLWERLRPAGSVAPRARRPAPLGWVRAATAAAAVAVAAALVLPTDLLHRFAARDAQPEATFVETPLEELRAFVDSRRGVDLASADLEALRDWFAGKIDYALPTPATRPEVRLVGARLCYFLDHRVASLMYESGGRTLSLYVIPAAPAGLASRASRTVAGEPVVVYEARGYAQVMWRHGDLVHALAADLPVDRLLEISRDFVASTRPAPRTAGVWVLAHAYPLASGAAAGAR
jgi:anti-sigma factor RsiW